MPTASATQWKKISLKKRNINIEKRAESQEAKSFKKRMYRKAGINPKRTDTAKTKSLARTSPSHNSHNS